MLMLRLDRVVDARSIDRRGRLLTYRTSQVPRSSDVFTTVAPRAENTNAKRPEDYET